MYELKNLRGQKLQPKLLLALRNLLMIILNNDLNFYWSTYLLIEVISELRLVRLNPKNISY